MPACSDTGQPAARVRGLAVPVFLAELMASGRWRHPGDDVLGQVLPWFADSLDFLTSTERMERESGSLDLYAGDPTLSRLLHVVHGSATSPIWLPWLDGELAFFIAVNRHAGDDVALALDYRGNADHPAVVASDCWTYPGGAVEAT